MEEVHENFKGNLDVTLPYTQSSFKVKVDTYGKTVPHSVKIELIEVGALCFPYLTLLLPKYREEEVLCRNRIYLISNSIF